MTSENVHPIQQALIASRYVGYCVSTSLDGKETAKIPALDLERILKGIVTFAGDDFPLSVTLENDEIPHISGFLEFYPEGYKTPKFKPQFSELVPLSELKLPAAKGILEVGLRRSSTSFRALYVGAFDSLKEAAKVVEEKIQPALAKYLQPGQVLNARYAETDSPEMAEMYQFLATTDADDLLYVWNKAAEEVSAKKVRLDSFVKTYKNIFSVPQKK